MCNCQTISAISAHSDAILTINAGILDDVRPQTSLDRPGAIDGFRAVRGARRAKGADRAVRAGTGPALRERRPADRARAEPGIAARARRAGARSRLAQPACRPEVGWSRARPPGESGGLRGG